MARRSIIKTEVPQALREEFNAKLVAGGFADYDGLTDWLNARLSEQGLAIKVSRSTAAKYGSEFQEQFERDMSEQRQLYQLAKTSLIDGEDTEGVVREATIRSMQARLWRITIALREAEESGDDPHLMAKTSSVLAKAIGELARSDIMSQKFKQELRKQIRKEAAEELTTELKNDGISPELEASIRRILIGK